MSDFFSTSGELLKSKTEWIDRNILIFNNFNELSDGFRFIAMASSYIQAAKILFTYSMEPCIKKQAEESLPVLELDSVIVPFAFLCRQSIELSMKSGIIYYDPQCDLKIIGHSLEKAWDHFCNLNVNNDAFYLQIQKQFKLKDIRKISAYDASGECFRYPQNLKGHNADAVNPLELLNFSISFLTAFKRICQRQPYKTTDNHDKGRQ